MYDVIIANGTVVDGVSVLQAYLREGSVLSIGAIRVEVHGSRAASFVPMSGRESFGELVGRSAAMRSAFAALERAAGSDATAEGSEASGVATASPGTGAAGVAGAGADADQGGASTRHSVHRGGIDQHRGPGHLVLTAVVMFGDAARGRHHHGHGAREQGDTKLVHVEPPGQ